MKDNVTLQSNGFAIICFKLKKYVAQIFFFYINTALVSMRDFLNLS